MSECASIYSVKHHCTYSQSNCDTFHSFYFCSLDESPIIYPILLLQFIYLIYLLGSTADLYFSPALSSLSKALKLSPTIAGVTLLAFGNGAPDVFSSILAAKKSKISLTVGALFGGAIFVSCVVFGRVAFSTNDCKMNIKKITRDCCLLFLTTLVIMIYGFLETITLPQACLFPMIYILYVVAVFYMEKKKNKLLQNYFEMPNLESNYITWGEIIENYVDSNPKNIEALPSILTKAELSEIRARLGDDEMPAFSELNIFHKVLFILTYPVDKLRELTIPYYTTSSWNRWKASAFPLLSSLFFLYSQDRNLKTVLQSNIQGFSLLLVTIGVSVTAGILIFCTSKRTVLPSYNKILYAASFFMSVIWICTICEIMVDLLTFLGLLVNLPISFLGLTLLAWGNSAGDFWANPSIAQIGMGQTAVTACFAGPLFNTLIGFGVSLIVSCSYGDVKFNILEYKQLLLAGSCLMIASAVTAGYLISRNGYITRFHGMLQIGLYNLFFVALIIFTAS